MLGLIHQPVVLLLFLPKDLEDWGMALNRSCHCLRFRILTKSAEADVEEEEEDSCPTQADSPRRASSDMPEKVEWRPFWGWGSALKGVWGKRAKKASPL